MRKLLNTEIIKEIAIELGVDPSFVEKDWYAVQAIQLIAENSDENNPVIFSGGTSLSKGYGLIQRFSEDLDFQITGSATTRGERREFRENIIQLINRHEELEVQTESVKSRDSSKFFSFNILYPQTHELNPSLRPNLKLEVTFKEGDIPTESRDIQSFVSQYMEEESETQIKCVTPFITAVDKYSALLWRINARNRDQVPGTPQNDPTIIRHLHDLAALSDAIIDKELFKDQLERTYVNDQSREDVSSNEPLQDRINKILSILQNEEDIYRGEYSQFVDAMSYATEDEKIDYDTAYDTFQKISNMFIGS